MNEPLFIGIDAGTQGAKAIAVRQGNPAVLAEASAAYGLDANENGAREQAPHLWTDAVHTCLATLLAQPGVAAADVAAIGVSGQQHGCVALDAAGRVLAPAKLWCDTETVAECDEITERAGGTEAVINITGSALAVGFTASKVLWLKKHRPDIWPRVTTILLPHDYINFHLTGNRCMECGDASGTGYFDIHKREWSPRMVDAIDASGRLAAALPPLIASDAPAGTLRPELADCFGLPRNVLVSSGGGDNMMAAIGTGNVREGIITCSLGTSGTLFAFANAPVSDPRGELAGFCSSSGGWLPLICTMNVTVATEAMRALFGLGLADYDAEAAVAEPGAGGLRLLPYLNGERTPALPRARGTLTGLATGAMTRGNFCRAAMEGATLGLRYGLDVLRRQNLSPAEIRLVGGGAKSRVWRQMAADVFGCPVVSPASTEAGAMGAVLQAMWCHGTAPLTELADAYITPNPATRAEPVPAVVRRYDEIYGEYLRLNQCMAPYTR